MYLRLVHNYCYYSGSQASDSDELLRSCGYVCVRIKEDLSKGIYVCECMCVCVYVYMYICMYICIYVCMYVGFFVQKSLCFVAHYNMCMSAHFHNNIYFKYEHVYIYVCIHI